jgi:hypothetical protein
MGQSLSEVGSRAHCQESDRSALSPLRQFDDWGGPMADPRHSELVMIFAVASLASLVAWELDYEVLSALFAAAAGVAFAMTSSE